MIDLYNGEKSLRISATIQTFVFYWDEEGESKECEIRALNLNEAIGAFLVEHKNMSYNDIVDCYEV